MRQKIFNTKIKEKPSLLMFILLIVYVYLINLLTILIFISRVLIWLAARSNDQSHWLLTNRFRIRFLTLLWDFFSKGNIVPRYEWTGYYTQFKFKVPFVLCIMSCVVFRWRPRHTTDLGMSASVNLSNYNIYFISLLHYSVYNSIYYNSLLMILPWQGTLLL